MNREGLRKAYLTEIMLILSFMSDAVISLFSRVYADLIGTILFITFLFLSYEYLWRDAWKLYIIGALTGFVFEFIGVHTGIPFGSYRYIRFKSNLLGVPIPISMAWGSYLTVTYLTSSSLIEGNRCCKYLLTGILMVVIDLAADPIMVSNNIWRWNINTYISWFGIPLTNYIGWITVSLTAIYLYGCIGGDPVKIDALYLSPIAYLTLFMTMAPLVTRESFTPYIISIITASFIISYFILAKRHNMARGLRI